MSFRAELATFLRDKTHLARLGLHEVHEVIDRLLGEGYTISHHFDHQESLPVAPPVPVAPVTPSPAPAPVVAAPPPVTPVPAPPIA